MKKILITALLGTGVIVAGCTSQKEPEATKGKEVTKKEPHKAEWGYKGDIGSDKWGDLSEKYKLCKTGKSQSPIDIRETKKEKLPQIVFNYQESKLKVINNGHTIKVKYDEGNYIKYKDKRCNLLQFHFHTPSEHLIQGRAYPMEVHLVHKCEDESLLVIGVMMREGKEHKMISDIWKVMPEKAGESAEVDIKIHAKYLLPENRSYYTYPGSLTTPPCTEGVTWIVMKNSIEVSKEQINKFKSLYDMNSRPVQPLNNRVVKEAVF